MVHLGYDLNLDQNICALALFFVHLLAEHRLGHLGSLERSVQRIISSLRNWGILTPADKRHAYIPQRQAFSTSQPELEVWLLASVLKAHPAEEIHFSDLFHLPALFPFRFTLTAHDLRQSPQFEVQRQGLGFDMVRLVA